MIPDRQTAIARGWTHQVQWMEDGRPCFVRCISCAQAESRAAEIEKTGEEPVVIDLRLPGHKNWRCFFCDEIFDRAEDAAKHFGAFDSCEADITACKIKAHEGHLVTYIRKLENELRRYVRDDSDVQRALVTLEGDVARQVQEAEERGYAKGVADMKAQGFCTEPAVHTASAA
jgi:hypothetical protein